MINSFIDALIKEPPFRVIAAAFIKRFSASIRLKELWDTAERPQYLTGILFGAEQALRQGVKEISVIEFGVAGGRGLLAMQQAACDVEAETGVKIHVFGFDLGSGLGSPSGGYRDHPDKWQAGDFPMNDMQGLQSKLDKRTQLILGNVQETVVRFLDNIQKHPIGFVSYDMDYYSSTMDALKIFGASENNRLIHVPLYFDDTLFFGASEYAGERLAIREFNEKNSSIKIDRWLVLPIGRPFPERGWLKGMYVANDLAQMESFQPEKRTAQMLPL
ncbi:MAG: hypothetical protein ACOY2B_11870 [Pseudomonadota bacterium]